MVALIRRPSISTLLHWTAPFPSWLRSRALSQAPPHKGTKCRLSAQLPGGGTIQRTHTPHMSLVSMSFIVFRGLAAVLAAVTLPVLCQSAFAAEPKRPAASTMVKAVPAPTGSELVGKLLSEQSGPSDPDVP